MHAAAPAMTDPSAPNWRIVDAQAGEAERTWTTFGHLVGLLSLMDFSVLGLIGALVMWYVKRGQSPFIDDHTTESVNFQISLLIYAAIGVALSFISLGLLAIPAVLALAFLRIWGCVRGAMAAHRGEYYRYPMSFRFVA
jgi:uncharacterized Tic20 family protein